MEESKLFKESFKDTMGFFLLTFVLGIPFFLFYVIYSILDIIYTYTIINKIVDFNSVISIFIIFLMIVIIAYKKSLRKLIADMKKQLLDNNVEINDLEVNFELKSKLQLETVDILKADYIEKASAHKQMIEAMESQRKKKWEEKFMVLDLSAKEMGKLREDINKLITEKSQQYPWLSKVFADYVYIHDGELEKELKRKKRPAIAAAQVVADIKRDKRDLQLLCKMYEYQLNYYETVMPWLEEFKEIDPREAYEIINHIDNDDDNEYSKVKEWLSPEDYQKLNSEKKWQLAMDRYNKRKKNSWEIGIEYERYVGYLYESEGYKVKYVGALLGLKDMGRDIIAEDEENVYVIQCKRWKEAKEIHEKHILQLYGSVVLLQIKNPDKKYTGILITTTTVSDVAKECAEYLGIVIGEKYEFLPHPLVKCKNSKSNEKIYHLPFDQQYDRIQINQSNGDCFIETVAEAEALGFRHAYRWKGNFDN